MISMQLPYVPFVCNYCLDHRGDVLIDTFIELFDVDVPIVFELGSKMGHLSNCGLEFREKGAFPAGSGRIRDATSYRRLLSLLSDLCGRFVGGRIAVFCVFLGVDAAAGLCVECEVSYAADAREGARRGDY